MFWTYEGREVNTPPFGSIGFIYEICNEIDGRRYIGKKSLVKSKLKKSGSRNKRVFTESDWRDYYGSNKELLADIDYYGAVNFTREILKWCISKGDMNYYELKYQIQYEVLEHPERYYNSYIGGRINRNHLSSNKKPSL